MNSRGAVLAAALLLSGCVYYNAIYNAERRFHEAEALRARGLDSLAQAAYQEVIDKSARGYRAAPDGEWSDDALYLLGRAHLRRGELRAADAALSEAAKRARGGPLEPAIQIYQAAVLVESGRHEEALPLLNASLRRLPSGSALAEGHLWRARVLLGEGRSDAGWWDLDRAADGDPALALPAALERVRWGITLDEPGRAQEGVTRLLGRADGAYVRDSLAALLDRAAGRWGHEAAAGLLGHAEDAAWDRRERGHVLLARARHRHRSGDLLGAEEDARAVASGVGGAAALARRTLALWRLHQAGDLEAARAVIPILLPAEGDTAVTGVLADVQALLALAEAGADEPLGYFAAAELARDRLEAPTLSRALYLAYADGSPESPWSAKALLAALEVSEDPGDRAWLRGRLEGHALSPYVLAARGRPAPGFEELEEELARRLGEIRP